MPKIIFLIGIIISTSITTSDIFAEIKSILPVKKPILTNTEIQKKITKNILTPIKKPSNKKEANNEKIISKDKKEKIYSFKIPKKKPTTKSIVKTSSIKISKYYNKKDFSLAKKSISEMEKRAHALIQSRNSSYFSDVLMPNESNSFWNENIVWYWKSLHHSITIMGKNFNPLFNTYKEKGIYYKLRNNIQINFNYPF